MYVQFSRRRRAISAAAVTAIAASLLVLAAAASATAGGYRVHPLVTDDQSVLATLPYGPAPTVDPALINPWDFANSSSGPWVIANTGGPGAGAPGAATVYNGAGKSKMMTVAIPESAGPPYGPTGAVYVGGAGFKLPGDRPAKYVFDNLDGSLSGWNPQLSSAVTVVPGRDGGNLAAYTGLEVATVDGRPYLYAVNNITGAIDIFDSHYQKASLAGSFVDPGPNPDGLLPFNIQNLDGHMWVTYAIPGPPASGAPLGSGFVSEFTLDGVFMRRFATGGRLSSPWGIATSTTDRPRASSLPMTSPPGPISAHCVKPANRLCCRGCGRCSSVTAAMVDRPTGSTSRPASDRKATDCSVKYRRCHRAVTTAGQIARRSTCRVAERACYRRFRWKSSMSVSPLTFST